MLEVYFLVVLSVRLLMKCMIGLSICLSFSMMRLFVLVWVIGFGM